MADEPAIKTEPDTGGSPDAMEDDLYEDTGDLEFYDAQQKRPIDWDNVYLARVPKYIWEAWHALDDNDEIELGTVRIIDGQHIKLLLNPKLAQHQGIPKEYTLDTTEPNLNNAYMFTEKDVPSYAAKNKQRIEAANQNIPMALTRQKPETPQRQPGERRGRWQPYYRKAIPKKTSLAGRFRREVLCAPVDNEETRHILDVRAMESLKAKKLTTVLGAKKGLEGKGIIHAGTTAANFSSFIKTSAKPKPTKKPELKAARISQGELRDRIFACFRRYTYWSMKALRAEIVQPEVWLRQNLEEVAMLHKSGRFANLWSLKPEYLESNGTGSAEVAPDANPDDASEADAGEDEESIKMEDVLPS